MNYCDGVEGLTNYTLSNPKTISEDDIKCSCKKYKNKNFLDPDVVMIHFLQKGFMKKHLCPYPKKLVLTWDLIVSF
jgi:hypothetical protein